MPTKSENLLAKSKTFEQQLKCFILGELERITAGSSSAGLATEATLISVLNAIIASDQDIEVLLVRDTVTLIVYKQITDWTSGVPVVSYTDVNGNPFVPVNTMEYLDPSTVLNLILAQNTAINNKLTSVTRTPALLRVSGASTSSVIAGSRSVSFFNAGLTNATVAGGVLLPGEQISFSAGGEDDVLGAIAYVTIATGDLMITTII